MFTAYKSGVPRYFNLCFILFYIFFWGVGEQKLLLFFLCSLCSQLRRNLYSFILICILKIGKRCSLMTNVSLWECYNNETLGNIDNFSAYYSDISILNKSEIILATVQLQIIFPIESDLWCKVYFEIPNSLRESTTPTLPPNSASAYSVINSEAWIVRDPILRKSELSNIPFRKKNNNNVSH